MRNINISFIGSGRIAKIHAKNLLSIKNKNFFINILGCYSLNLNNSKKFVSKFGGTVYKTFDDLVLNNPDGVYICIPPSENGKYESELINKNINFFVEKPGGTSLNNSVILKNINKLKKYTGTIHVGYQWKYWGFLNDLKKFISCQNNIIVKYNRDCIIPFDDWILKSTENFSVLIYISHFINLIKHLFGDFKFSYGYKTIDNSFLDISLFKKNSIFKIQFSSVLKFTDNGGHIEFIGNNGVAKISFNNNYIFTLELKYYNGFDFISQKIKSSGEYMKESLNFILDIYESNNNYEQYIDMKDTLNFLNKINGNIGIIS